MGSYTRDANSGYASRCCILAPRAGPGATATHASCPCHRIPDRYKIDGHLLTADGTWGGEYPQTLPALDLLGKVGLTHVLVRALDVDVVIEEYGLAVPNKLLDVTGWPLTIEDFMMPLITTLVSSLCA